MPDDPEASQPDPVAALSHLALSVGSLTRSESLLPGGVRVCRLPCAALSRYRPAAGPADGGAGLRDPGIVPS